MHHVRFRRRGEENQAQALARLRTAFEGAKVKALCRSIESLRPIPVGMLDGKPIAAFALGATPITWAAWEEFLALTGGMTEKPQFAGPTHPVVNVSPEDCERFCAWLSKVSGVAFRLPTHLELEYAAREGGKPREYPWGNTFDTAKLWCFKQRQQPGTVPVDRPENRFTNSLGLSELAGNVGQWCADGERGNRYYKGGSWASNYDTSFRCSAVVSGPPQSKAAYIGFRLASSELP